MDTAKTRITCPVCKDVVGLATRDGRTTPDGERDPYYITTSGTHQIENAPVFGRRYPDVYVSQCGARP